MFAYTTLLASLSILLKITNATKSITISVPEGDEITFVYPTTVVTDLDEGPVTAVYQDDSFVSSVVALDLDLYNFIQTETDPEATYTKNMKDEPSSFVDAANVLYWMIEENGLPSGSLLDQMTTFSSAASQLQNSSYYYPFSTAATGSYVVSNYSSTYSGPSSHTIAAEGTTISESTTASSISSFTTTSAESTVSTAKTTKSSNTTTAHGSSSSGAAGINLGSSLVTGAFVAAFVLFM